MRQTSIDTYNEIRAEGLLGRLQWLVYDYLFQNGPCSQKEVAEGLGYGNSLRSITPRFIELERKKAAYLLPEEFNRPDRYTGRTVELWDVTGNRPIKVSQENGKTTYWACLEHLKFVGAGVKQCPEGSYTLFPCRVHKLKEI